MRLPLRTQGGSPRVCGRGFRLTSMEASITNGGIGRRRSSVARDEESVVAAIRSWDLRVP